MPFAQAYAFAQEPQNFTKWAVGLSKTLHKTAQGWVADTPEGRAVVTFSELNEFGVLDHRVQLDGKPAIYIPVRMIAHGKHTIVELALIRQPDMSYAKFQEDAELITKDLKSLKAVLEGLTLLKTPQIYASSRKSRHALPTTEGEILADHLFAAAPFKIWQQR